jgi:hypothetical protein
MVAEKSLYGVSWFVAYQSLVTFAGVQGQAGVFLYQPDSHAIAGNGANGALQRFFPGVPVEGYGAGPRKAQLAALQSLKQHVAGKAQKLFGRKASQWRLQAAEHTPCEFFNHRKGVLFFARRFGVRLAKPTDEEGKAPRRRRRALVQSA